MEVIPFRFRGINCVSSSDHILDTCSERVVHIVEDPNTVFVVALC